MHRIDVICEPENLPRIRLLANHMQTLQIELVLHDETPPDHSNRIVYVPKRKDSRFKKSPKSPDFERIALYLDEDMETIDAEMAVELVTWPGRSSDEAVARLASYLHRPFNPANPERRNTDKNPKRPAPIRVAKDAISGVKQKLKASSQSRAERRNTLIFVCTAVAVIGFFSWLDLAPSENAKEPAETTDHPRPRTSNTAIPRSIQTTPADIPSRLEQPSSVGEPERVLPKDSSAEGQIPSFTDRRVQLAAHTAGYHADHTYLLCATQEDRLRGLLLTAPYTHNEPCRR